MRARVRTCARARVYNSDHISRIPVWCSNHRSELAHARGWRHVHTLNAEHMLKHTSKHMAEHVCKSAHSPHHGLCAASAITT